jgi:hypothetical protein
MNHWGLRNLSYRMRIIMQPALAVAAVVGFVAVAGGAESEATLVASDASLSEIMMTIVTPSSDALWNAVVLDVTVDGEVFTGPESDEEWQRIRTSAVDLAAVTDKMLDENLPVSNAVQVEPPTGELGSAQIANLRTEKWQAWTAHVNVLHEVAESAVKMVDARDAKGLSEVGEALYDTCESCHTQFWYPQG